MKATVVSRAPSLRLDLVLRHPVVDRRPVEVVEERIDVRRAVGLVVEEVRVLVHVERDQRRRVPDRERVLCVADVVEQPPLVPVVRGPTPPTAGHACRLQIGAPGLKRAEVPLDQVPDHPVGIAAASAEMLEVDLVVLDSADREGEVDLQRADVGVDLVGARRVDAVQLLEDLVSLVDVTLVELVVSVDRRPRDPVELVQLGLQLPRGDLLEFERKRGHGRGAYPRSTLQKGVDQWPSRSRPCRTTTARSSRTSTSRRCASTTTSTTRLMSTTRTRRSREASGPTGRSRTSLPTSRSSPRTSAPPC